MKISKVRLKEIIKEEVARFKNEGRYHFANAFDELDVGEDPRVQAFEQCIKILNDLTYDSLEGEVASMADDAARALWKAAGELDYLRNRVGNISEALGSVSERLENESEIKEVERALDQVSSIVKMTTDAAVLDRAEYAEEILVGLLQKMYGAERTGV